MIFYATKLTYERLHIQPSEALHYAAEDIYPQYDYINSVKKTENWSEIYEWYIELFYYGGKKCLRAVHLSSMFTLFFDGVDEAFMHGFGYRIRKQLYKYYISDPETTRYLDLLFSDSFLNFYSRINDRSRLKHYDIKETVFDENSPFYKRFICGSEVDTVALNKAINSEYPFKAPHSSIDTSFHSGEKLKELLYRIYGNLNHKRQNVVLKQNISLSMYEHKTYADS